jgi:hypothetical protein
MQLAGSKDGGSVYDESDREVQNGNSGRIRALIHADGLGHRR